MRVINLVDETKTDIKYKISQFPDGQQNITLKAYKFNDIWIATQLHQLSEEPVKIISHLNNFLDLEIIIATVACLRELDVEKIHLVTPYFVGARSDRKFEDGGNWYLKDVICPIINSLKFASVLILDPHSWVLGNLITKFKYISNEDLVKWAIYNIYPDNEKRTTDHSYCKLVSPDAGASHKIEKLAKSLDFKGDIITCSKERDTEGNLTKTVVPLPYQVNNGDYLAYRAKDFIIIDDICDGGRTFINIAKELRNNGVTGKIYLIVTHGIFSAGFEELNENFDGIFCTDSYSTVGDYASFYGKLIKTNVTQLKVYE